MKKVSAMLLAVCIICTALSGCTIDLTKLVSASDIVSIGDAIAANDVQITIAGQTYPRSTPMLALMCDDPEQCEPLDLSQLAQFPYLKVFSTNYRITDLSPLADCKKLEELELERIDTDDLSVLTEIERLDSLLSSHNFTSSELSQLAPLTGLSTLAIGLEDDVTNIDALSGMTQLRVLALEKSIDDGVSDMTFGKFRDISAVRNMPKLEVLSLCCEAEDFSVVGCCTELEVLMLYSKGLRDISWITGCTKLNDIQLYAPKLEDISPLKSCVELKYIALNDCYSIRDFDMIGDFPKLSGLSLSGVPVDDIGFLGQTSLVELQVHDTKIPASQLEDYQKQHPDCIVVNW